MPLIPGTRVDRYVVESVIGSGGMADVYAVRHATLGTPAALKVLRVRSPQLNGRMVREGRAQARLNHPNVVPVLDLFEVEGAPGLLMERVDGPNLGRLLQDGPLPLARVERLARGLMAGLHAAHQLGIVHRDLKPANVLVSKGDVPRIADFGLATALADDTAPGLTRPGTAIGTPAYMAPEQHEDASRVDARADVFALGVVLYEMVCGLAPAAGANLLAAWQQMSQKRWRSVSEAVPGTPERIDKAIAWALEPDRSARAPDVPALWERFFGEPFPSELAPARGAEPAFTVLDVPPSGGGAAGSDSSAGHPASGVPKPVRPLVGRIGEIDAVLDPFDAGGALITLVGTAGVGKTRIATEVAARWQDQRRSVVWVELASARDEQELVRAVAFRLEEIVRHDTDRDLTTAFVGRALWKRGALLLVLDNLEQLPRAAAQVVATWVRAAPSLRILATSRQPLGTPEEHVIEVPPLPLPDSDDDALLCDAWAMLAGAAPVGALDGVDPARARRLLRALDGLPLALELAGTRLEVLDVDELERRLSDRFAVLTDPGLSGERHGALYDAIAWSWHLLAERERSVLAEISTFAGAFSLEAAEGIATPAGEVLDALHALVRRSLVRRVGKRFALLVAIREFAARHLTEAQRDDVWYRHARWHAERALALQETGRLGSIRASSELAELAGDFAAVLDRARSLPGLAEHALACALGRCALYEVRGPMLGLLRTADEALALDAPDTDVIRNRRASLRMRRCLALRRTGRGAEAEAELERLASEPIDERLLAIAAANLADVYQDRGRIAEAYVLYDRAAQLAERHDVLHVLATVSASMGATKLAAGDTTVGEQLVAKAFAAAPPEDHATLLELHKAVAWVRMERDELDEAEVAYRQVVGLADRLGARRARLYALGQLGLVAEARGDLVLAEERFATCAAGMAEDGDSTYAAYYEGFRGRVLMRLGKWAEGLVHVQRALADTGLAGGAGTVVRYAEALALARARLQRDARTSAEAAEDLEPEVRAVPGSLAAAYVALDAGDRAAVRAALAEVGPRIPRVTDLPSRALVTQLVEELAAEAGAWRIAADGSGAEAPDGQRISLARHAANARILAYLARMRADRPGVGTDALALAGAGWPGERIVPSAAANRVRVALSALRRAGLADLIERVDGGWRLDPRQVVRYPEGPAPADR